MVLLGLFAWLVCLVLLELVLIGLILSQLILVNLIWSTRVIRWGTGAT